MDREFQALLAVVREFAERSGTPMERVASFFRDAPGTAPTNRRSDETLWDARDVSRFLKVSVSWVYKRSEAGELPHRRIGGLLRFKADEVRDWAERNGRGDSKVIPLKRGG